MSKTSNQNKKRRLLRCHTNNLNKATRFQSNDNDVKASSSWPQLPPIYTSQELLNEATKEIIQIKPVLNKIKSELGDNNAPIVTLTWNVIYNKSNDNNSLLENIKEYEIFSYKESINNHENNDQEWTIVI